MAWRGVAGVATGALLAAAALAGCGGGGAADGEKPLRVAVTTSHLADFARTVGGDRVHVHQILRPGVSPHDHDLTSADIDAVSRSDVVVHNGLGLESFWDDLVAAAEPRGMVVTASDGSHLRRGERRGPGDHDGVDPHVWHDARNAKVMVENISRACAEADPAGAALYQANTTAYLAQLEALDAEIAQEIATVEDSRVVTNHDSFGYYFDRYGLKSVASIIPNFDSTTELSVAEVTALVGRIRGERVRAVFAESDVSDKTVRAVAEAAGVRFVAGEGALFGDSLGPPGSGANTYLAMMRHNTRVLVDNLRG